MNTLNYFVEANVGILVMYGVYLTLLSKETDFGIQRNYLLVGLLTSVLIPFINVTTPTIALASATVAKVLPEIILTASNPGVLKSETGWTTTNVFLLTYLSGVVIVLIPMIVQAYRLFSVFRYARKTKDGVYSIVESTTESPSYSFFRIVVVGQTGRLTADEQNMIIVHEKYHGKLLHSIDVLVMTLLLILFWFNPVVWLYRRTMLRIHEYQVDNLVAGESSSSEYSILLAKSVLIRSGFFLAHPFNQSFILKRINMINKLKSRISSWKLMTVATIVLGFGVIVACTDQVSQTEVPSPVVENLNLQDRPSQVSDRLAALQSRYPGTTFEAIRIDGTKTESLWSEPGQSLEYLEKSETRGDWAIISRQQSQSEIFTEVDQTSVPEKGMTAFYGKISDVLIYPEQARMRGIEGKVFVQFVVQPDGRLSDFKVVKGIHPDCDAAALNAVMQSDDWKPGEHKGKAVAQQMVLPIVFKLG